MADRRKLQGEIDRCHKKVQEGVEIFEDIWQKAHNAPNINQKEKYEGDLKKEIKKLQRLRDQIKTWIASSEIKDKRVLVEDRKLIETQMERFKVLERETKTKAYSKEGLGAAQKLDPAQREKEELCGWITNSIESLNIQIDQFESEIESISVHLRKKKNDKDKQERIEKLKTSVDKHKYHINQLETLMRMLDNSTIDVCQVKSIKDDVDYYVESSQELDFEENEFIYEDLELEDINEFLNKSKLNNAKDQLNNHQTSTSFENNKTSSTTSTSNSCTNNTTSTPGLNNSNSNNNDEEGTNSIQSTTHTSPSISPATSPGPPTTVNKSLDQISHEFNHDKSSASSTNFVNHSLESNKDKTSSSDCTASSSINSPSSLLNNSSTQSFQKSTINSVWSHNTTPTTNSTTSVSSTSLINNLNSYSTTLLESVAPINTNNNNNLVIGSLSSSDQSSVIGSTILTQEQQQSNVSGSTIIQQQKTNNPITLYAAATHHQLSAVSRLISNNNKNSVTSESNGPISQQQQKTAATTTTPEQENTVSNVFSTSDSIIRQQFKSSQLSPQPQLVNVNAADLYHQASLTSSAWNNLNSLVNSRTTSTITSTTPNNQLLNGPTNLNSQHSIADEQQKLTSLKSMALQAMNSARISANSQQQTQPQQQQTDTNETTLQQQQLKQSNNKQQLNQTNSAQLYEQSNASIMNLLGANKQNLVNNQSVVNNLVSNQQSVVANNQLKQQQQQTTNQSQQPATNEAHISPMLGVAPLGPITLTKPMIYQMHMLESAARHIIHPMDSQRTRSYLTPNTFPTPSYYPQQALSKCDTIEFFDRLSTETLFFVFYFMEGTKAQFLAAKTLKKQSWRFHTKFMMWFQRHEEPKAITDEYEQGTYIYFDYEKWGQRKKEHFTFEYRYLEDRELS